MSVLIVSKACIDKAVFAMLGGRERSGMTAYCDEPNQLGKSLFQMNVKAFVKRYPKKGLQDVWYWYDHWSDVRPTNVEALKACQCLLHQYNEDMGPLDHSFDSIKLLKQLEETISSLSIDIIQGLPEYEKAPWG